MTFVDSLIKDHPERLAWLRREHLAREGRYAMYKKSRLVSGADIDRLNKRLDRAARYIAQLERRLRASGAGR